SRRRHTRFSRDWSSDVCSSDLGVRAVGAAERAVGDLSFHVLVDADLLPDLETLRHLLSPLVSAMTTTCSAPTFCDVSVLRAMNPLSRPVGWTFSMGTTRPVERSDSVSRTTASELRTTLPCRVGYAMTTPGRISAPVKSVSRALPMSALLCEWLVYVEFEEAPERLVGLLRGDAVADRLQLLRPRVALRRSQAGHSRHPAVRQAHQPLGEASRQTASSTGPQLSGDGSLSAGDGLLAPDGRLEVRPVLDFLPRLREQEGNFVVQGRAVPSGLALVRVLCRSVGAQLRGGRLEEENYLTQWPAVAAV